MNTFKKIQEALADILDVEKEGIDRESYLMRDLEAESIDLLELAVSLNSEFKIEINDDEIFLKTLRIFLDEPGDHVKDRQAYLMEKYPYLTMDRIDEIMNDLTGGPVLKVKDLISYIEWRNGDC